MEKPYVIGIDMGGTNTVFGIVDVRGNVISKSAIKTAVHDDVNLYVNDIYHELMKLIDAEGGIDQIRGIGVGAPNGNYYSGNIEYAPNLPWKGVIPFAKLLNEKFGVPVALTNDANAAAIGEMAYGIARGMKDFIMITLGTGVGSGIVIDGKLVYGHDGFAGELGHTTSIRNGRLCGCGKNGCLEAYSSATGVARTAREILETTNQDSILRNIPLADITSKDVYDAAKEGDQVAIDIFNFTGKILGEAFADFVAFSSPEAIILFGGLSKAGEFILNPIIENMEKNLLPIWKGKIKILFSELKESDAAVLGASALAWEL
ncbi:MAG TPA: ROK family protein [Paludibacteraceae bacterium]|nr:ROK family protein [Paludibacteraceae bacterium]HOF98610.1 ROK family protein [Paludibacteraceae bacterium]HON02510.1 ROK family protein [Paludibacteraceae bacterium]HPD59259.1 ROK family protein [Paludibacteraceae bacterium]HPL76422.1 ROK family protein [Paludibacteraceae bacterium]